MKTLLLIDAHAMIHRAYHALPATFTSADGTPTNAVYGFFMMIQKVITDFRPTHIAICFDTPKPTFRKKLYPTYQAKRPPMEDTLKIQIPIIRNMLVKGGLTCLDSPSFEADDVIGTMAVRFQPDADRILILTGDRDILQLATEKTHVIAPKKGVSEFTMFTPESVSAKLGVSAAQIPDYKALAGDSSDNYHATPGIGPKTAAILITQFSSIEMMYERLDEINNPKWKTILLEHKDEVILLKRIATIVQDLNINISFDNLVFQTFSDDLKEDLKKYQLFGLLNKLYPSEKPVEEKMKMATKEVKRTISADQISMFE